MEGFVKAQLNLLDPVVLEEILLLFQKDRTVFTSEIAQSLKGKREKPPTRDSRIDLAFDASVKDVKFSPEHPIEHHQERGRGRYAFFVPSDGLWLISNGDDTNGLLQKYVGFHDTVGVESSEHLKYLIFMVRMLIHDRRVGAFMIGKVSRNRNDHPYAGMVQRFGDKYNGWEYDGLKYTFLIGIDFFDGNLVPDAERVVLSLESQLHGHFCRDEKFGEISNAQSGNLSKRDPKDTLYTLYIAIAVKHEAKIVGKSMIIPLKGNNLPIFK